MAKLTYRGVEVDDKTFVDELLFLKCLSRF